MKAAFDKKSARYVYILVRRDLPPAHQTVQAVHAAMDASAHFGLHGSERVVLLSVPCQDTLQEWSDRLEDKGIQHKRFFEPDHEHGWTALATCSMPRHSCFSRLPLWQPPSHDTNNA